MSDYTAREVEAAFEALMEACESEDFDEDAYTYFEDWSEVGYAKHVIDLRGERVTTEPVQSIGGEGQGDYAAIIFKVGDQYFRKEGWHQSHYGSEFDGALEEVEEYEKVVKRWRKVKT